MDNLIWALTCQRVIIDQQNNSVSYIDALDSIVVTALPVQGPPTVVATIWQRDHNEKVIAVRSKLYGPDGSLVFQAAPASLVYEPHHRRGRVHLYMLGYQLAKPGRHYFGVEVKQGEEWVEAKRIPFDVDLLVAESATGSEKAPN